MVNLFKVDRPLADYTAVFERAASSRFLSEPKSGWRCTIGWLTDPVNMDKVLAGKYDDYKKARSRKNSPPTIGDDNSGFDTEEFFQAALRRGMKGMKNGESESQ